MRSLGIAVAVIGLIGGIRLGGTVGAFVNVPSLLFVLFVGGGVIVASHGSIVVPLVWQVVFDRSKLGAAEEIHAKAIAETAMQAFVAAGWIGIIVGSVQMLGQLDDLSQIGDGMATALLTPLYGYVLAYVFCLPLVRHLSISPQGESTHYAGAFVADGEPTTTVGVG